MSSRYSGSFVRNCGAPPSRRSGLGGAVRPSLRHSPPLELSVSMMSERYPSMASAPDSSAVAVLFPAPPLPHTAILRILMSLCELPCSRIHARMISAAARFSCAVTALHRPQRMQASSP